MRQEDPYGDPSGNVYVAPFADDEEEAQWVEQEKRIMEARSVPEERAMAA